MERKVAIIDYISYVSKEEKPIGHPLKIMKECAEWLQPEYKILFVAARPYLDEIQSINKICLSCDIKEGKNYTSYIGKVKQMMLEWKNLHQVFRIKQVDYYWFCNIDIFLVFYLAIHPNKAAKCIITTYLSKFEKKYHNLIAKKVFRKAKLVIGSNRKIKYAEKNLIYVPDYLFKQTIYSEYANENKKNYVLCLGTMTGEKDLRGLISAFNQNGLRLNIIGYFSDNDYLQDMKILANKNIHIRNQYLQYEEYLSLIGTAKFCVLPYDKMAYAQKTSGVILESVFLNAIPICNNEILIRLGISGKGYAGIEELSDSNWFYEDYSHINSNNKELIKREYDEAKYIHDIRCMLQ